MKILPFSQQFLNLLGQTFTLRECEEMGYFTGGLESGVDGDLALLWSDRIAQVKFFFFFFFLQRIVLGNFSIFVSDFVPRGNIYSQFTLRYAFYKQEEAHW